MFNTTLCYIKRGEKYLMLNRNKKINDLNQGKWIGIGGKFMDGESPEECLKREVLEETGLVLQSWSFRGIIKFRSDKEDEDMYLFSAEAPEEFEPIDCNEGTLAWIDEDKVLSLPTWSGDRYFLEKLLAGENNINMLLRYVGDELVEVKFE